MAWTTVNLAQGADLIDWGTTNFGTLSTTTSFKNQDESEQKYILYTSIRDVPTTLSDLLAPVIDGYLPELNRPVSGTPSFVGEAASTRPASGLVYPRE